MSTKKPDTTNAIDEGVRAELQQIRDRFDCDMHTMLDDFLNAIDPQTGFTTRDVLISEAQRGHGISIGASTGKPPELDLEARAKASGIEIVKA